ncbi:PDZ domain-containing protein [Stieleria varia]|uniref:Periplasmic pH-dependent serine endoprotease DegQ n=1 Tax=Stieleria varia TaxID=2528005 RepID=A0A5C6A4T0_9BACT|nr:PDZ domain-containing protein [Stieleria varia]TWT94395.1 Periplasmic pH-dependent serine endoprotease DegQ precursor [Stieleria varia]
MNRIVKPLRIALAFTCVIFACQFIVLSIAQSADPQTLRVAMARAVRDAANEVLPSIVTIEIVNASDVTSQDDQSELEKDAPTCGFIVDDRGYVVCSDIVLRRPSASVLVVLPDGSRHAAKVVSRDWHRNLVLLKITTDKELTALTLPAELDLTIGSTVVATGRYGPSQSPLVSSGILSAVERLDGIALQTDARVSPSFYGGVLVDLYGKPIGVLIPAVAEGGAPDATSWYDSGIAFAVPTDVLKRKLDRMIDGTDIRKGLIGIVPKTNDPYKNGTELAAVRTRSPAENAGLKSGDVIVAIDGTPVKRFQEIRQVLGRFDAGEVIKIQYRRDKTESDVEVTLAETIPPLQPQRLGVLVSETTPADSPENDPPENDSSDSEDAVADIVIDDVVPGSAADGKLQTGDTLVKLDDAEINDLNTLRRKLISAEPKKEVTLTISRQGSEQQVTIVPTSIAGKAFAETLPMWKPAEKPVEDADKKPAWEITPMKLPDVSNVAAVLAPKENADAGPDRLGLLIVLSAPGDGSPEESLKAWMDIAASQGVVICIVTPAEENRWQPQEIDVVSRMAMAVLKRHPIAESAVGIATPGAIAGGEASAADAMALAVAMSDSRTFFGVAVSAKTRPPAVRLRENEPDRSLQLLLPIESDDELPSWGAALSKAGYPIVQGGITCDRTDLLRWIRLLQTI